MYFLFSFFTLSLTCVACHLIFCDSCNWAILHDKNVFYLQNVKPSTLLLRSRDERVDEVNGHALCMDEHQESDELMGKPDILMTVDIRE